jgi:hypothetical protein
MAQNDGYLMKTCLVGHLQVISRPATLDLAMRLALTSNVLAGHLSEHYMYRV